MMLAFLLLAVTSTLGSVAHAQGLGVIRVSPNADLPLAAPSPVVKAGGGTEAKAAWDAMWLDLKMSGYFELQDPSGYLEKNAGIEPSQFTFGPWDTIGTAVLVKTQLIGLGDATCDPEGTRVCADLRIYNVNTEEQLSEKRFRGGPTSARHLGHAMANHVIEIVTGTPGYFGTRLAAVNARTGNKEIYVLDSDGKGVQPVTRNGAINLSPAWAPDATEIAWTSYKKGNPDLYVKNLATGRTRTLSNARGVNTSPAFSPDGKMVAMSRSVDGDSDIFLLDARTGAELRRVTRGGGIDVSPNFSPNGASLAFASERSGGAQVYVMPVGSNSSEARRVTFRGDFNIDPVISPDGERFAFVGRSRGGFDIYVGDLEGRNIRRLTQDMGDNEDPTWSPDSRYLVFSSTRTGRSELWLATADGKQQAQITFDGNWTQPTWMPARAR